MKRRHKPQPKPQKPAELKHIPPGLQYAIYMASAQYQDERAARSIMAANKAVSEMQRRHAVATENWFYALMALALHDEGFGAKRILRVCERIRDWHNELNDPEYSDVNIWEKVADEVGLAFDPGIDGMVKI